MGARRGKSIALACMVAAIAVAAGRLIVLASGDSQRDPSDHRLESRKAAREVLAASARQSEDVLRRLVAALRRSDEDVRAAAAGALGQVGPPAKVAVKDLRERLGDGSPEVRRAASWALEALGESLPPAPRSGTR